MIIPFITKLMSLINCQSRAATDQSYFKYFIKQITEALCFLPRYSCGVRKLYRNYKLVGADISETRGYINLFLINPRENFRTLIGIP